ncbi:aminoglycoside N(3)-acetyltransferase [Deinococcus cavernae]|uniref:Aminoglycoside N(3)-acetyltransferase n=1 Tax=Deinococcus cavernae TaxID=2320857 RepID=A0A418VC01_9DEIO|nr:AAC(3) family N-acetyltransferase [Deinococcus cavernae]RJF73540.1 aminoglycoside N(3)-acetyltransferase [Deinococcus cavernae]
MLNLLRKPTVGPLDLDEGLAALGLDGTQHVIVHASLKSFGTLEGGARTVVDTLLARTATLVAPSFTYNTLMNTPTERPRGTFHRDSRVSRDIGRVPQEMVERADAERSFHPALSFVAIGTQAAVITGAQSLESPYQPIGALYDLDGYALLLGVDFGSNTTLHYAEHLAGVPALTRYVPLEGRAQPTAFPNCSADFDNLLPAMHGRERAVTVGQAQLRLYRVRELVDRAVSLLNREPEALLCQYRYCRCQQVRELIRSGGLHPREHHALTRR